MSFFSPLGMNEKIVSSYVYSQPPIKPQNNNFSYNGRIPTSHDDASRRPFIPFMSDEEMVQRQQQSLQVSDKKLILLTNLQDQIPVHHLQFLSYVFSSMNRDDEIEKLQQELAQDTAFSVSRLFRFFDINKDRKIQFDDFMLTLQKLDIVLKKEEIFQLFNRLGGEDDNIISYAEFVSLFTPKRTETKKFYDKSKITDLSQLSKPINDNILLSHDHQQKIRSMFGLYMSIERGLNELRSELNLDQIKDLFQTLDYRQLGYLILDDLTQYANKLGGNFKNNDFLPIFRRISKFESGRINEEEFIYEFGDRQALDLYEKENQLASQVTFQGNQTTKQNLNEINQGSKRPDVSPQRQRNLINNYMTTNKKIDFEKVPPQQDFVKYEFKKFQVA